jgi:hypothetical protein
MSDEIRDHGKIVTAPSGTSEKEIVDKLTGAADVPSLEELSRAKAPPFDPHAGREVEHGREFGDKPGAMFSTIVLMGVDRGGDFEDSIQQVLTFAETLGLKYITASVAPLDIDEHAERFMEITDEVIPEDDGFMGEDDEEETP